MILCKFCNERKALVEYSSCIAEAIVCWQCAEVIANAFNKAHGGVWLTRYNPPLNVKKKLNITQGLRRKVFERNEYRCVHCGTHKDLTVDHIKPESKGGDRSMDNLQTLCRSCNSKKGVKE